MPTALLIVNRRSRLGPSDVEPGVRLLARHGFRVRDEYFDDPARMPEAIRSRPPDTDRILVAGGDGTLNSVAEALLETGLPLGVIPLGTANDLARTLGIPSDLEGAAAVAATGRVERIDLGWVNGKHYFNAAGMGLGAAVTRRLAPEVKRRWGVLSYLLSALSAAREHRPFRAEISAEGRRRRVRSIHITVGNGPYFGGGMKVARDARIQDHRLDLFTVEPAGLWRLALLLPALRRGVKESGAEVLLLSGRELLVRTRPALDVTADGEVITRTPAHFRVRPSALPVLVPEPPPRPGQTEGT
jgi:YegS/Rv2252/BmrU family lipid kinase